MAYTTVNTTLPPNKGGGKKIRVDRRSRLKDLLKLQVAIEDTTSFSPYYFNILKKPEKLRMGGNIFEFAPPAGRFKRDTQILFEPVDINNKPIAYEVLQQTSQSIRICIFITEDVPEGPAQITIVGEVVIDDCGCPIPEEWQGKPNVRWSETVGTEKLSVSPVILYDEDPYGTLTETSIPWQYQTFEDVYDINPGVPGTPYTVSGSYQSNYNSQPTGSGTGKFNYTLDTTVPFTPNPPGGKALIQMFHGDFAFSSSMVGGILYVSGGIEHIHGPNPYPSPSHRFTVPNYYATISSILNSTTAEVSPAYQIISNIAPEVPSYYPSTWHAKNGFQLTWNESSSSIAYTDPTAPSSSMTREERTKEKATSYIDVELKETKPDCGVTTHIDVYVKSNRLEGELTKLTEFEITPWNFLIDDTKTTETGNFKAFEPIGIFDSGRGYKANTYWNSIGKDGQIKDASVGSSVLIDSILVTNELTSKKAYSPNLHTNTSYFIEFNAASKASAGDSKPPKIEVYVDGDCVDPSNISEPSKTALGYYVGCIENDANGSTVNATPFLNNTFEFVTQKAGSCNIRFKVVTGEWYISNIELLNCTDRPAVTGTTPNHIRALVPMPAITKFNDQYIFEFNYKNTVQNSDRKTIFTNKQFEGNDATDFLDSQPGAGEAIYNAIGAVTTSKSFYVTGSTYISNSLFVTNHAHVTGNVYVDGNVYSQEYHTNIVSSSILFDEGDTIFGNSIDDIHITTGSIYITSSLNEYITNNFYIVRPQGDRYIYVTNAHITMSGDISSSNGTINFYDGYIRNVFTTNNIQSTSSYVNIGPNVYIENNFTASGNISASGNFSASDGYIRNIFNVNNIQSTSSYVNIGPNLNVENHITASGNISASGTIIANSFESHGNTVIQINDNLQVVGIVSASRVSASISVTTNHLTASNFTTTNITTEDFESTRITASFLNVGSATGSFTGSFLGQANLTGSLLGTASYGRDNDWYTQGSSTIDGEPTITDKIYHNGKVGIGDYSSNDLYHQLAIDGTAKIGNNLSNEHNITGSIHMKHTNLSILSGSGRFGIGIANPAESITFSNTSAHRVQIYNGDTNAVGLQIINWETASAFTAGGGTIGGNELAARGPRALISVNARNSRGSYGYGGTRGQAGGSFSYLPDTFEGNTSGDDFGDGGDTDSEGIRLLQEALHISTGGNPQGSINIHARGDAGQQIRFFTGNDDARNTGGKDVETQRMTIKHGGEVGIGTHNPQRRFHVSKSINESSTEPIVRFTTLPTYPSTVPVNMVIVDSSGDLYQTGTDVLLSQVNQAGVTNLTSSNIFTTAFTSSVISSSTNIIANYFTASNSIITNITSTNLTSSNIFTTALTSSVISSSTNIIANYFTASNSIITNITSTSITASSVSGSFTGTFTTVGEAGFIGNLTGSVLGDLTGSVLGDLTGQVSGGLTGSVIGDVTGSLLGQVNGGLTGSMIGTASYATQALTASYGRDNDWYKQQTVYSDGNLSDPTIDNAIYHNGSIAIGDFSTDASPRMLHVSQSLVDYTAKVPPVRINSLHNKTQKNLVTYNSSSGDLSYTELGCALDLVDKDNCCCNLSANTNIYIFIDRTSMNIVGSATDTPAILTRWVISKFEADMREKYPYWKGNIYVGEGFDEPASATLTAERWLSWMSWPAVGNQDGTSTGSGITGSMVSVKWDATGVTDEAAGTYLGSDDFAAYGYSSSAYYLENSPISRSGIPDTDVIVFALVDECDAGNNNQGGGYHYRQTLIGSGSADGNALINDWENHLTTHYKADYGLFAGKAYPSYDCFSGYVYALPSSTNTTLEVRQNFALHIYGAIEKDVVSPASYVSFSPTTANLNAITSSNPYANGVNSVGNNSPWYTGGIYGLASQSISEKHDFTSGIAGWYNNIASPTEANINKSGSWTHGQASMSVDFFTFIDGNSIGVKVDGSTVCVNDANELTVITSSLFKNSRFTNISTATLTSSIVSSSNTIITNYFTASNAIILNDLHVHKHITASGNISASGILYASSSEGNYSDVVVQDISTGRFYTTSSTAIGTTDTFKLTGVRSGNGFIDGHITASGNIFLPATSNIIFSSSNATQVASIKSTVSELILQHTQGEKEAGIRFDTDGHIQFATVTDGDLDYDTDTKMFISSSGNVGIGTITPGEKLEVVGNISASGTLYGSEAHVTGHITASGNISSSHDSKITAGTGSFRRLHLGNTAVGALNSELHIRNAGSVNVNLDSFDQNGNQIINFLNNQEPDFSIGNYFSDGGFQIRSDQKKFLIIGADDGDEIFASGSLNVSSHITASGNISSSGTVKAGNVVVFNPGGTSKIGVGENDTYNFNHLIMESDGANNKSDFYTIGTGNAMEISTKGVADIVLSSNKNLYFKTDNRGILGGGTTRMFITGSTGNVGIGTATPEYPLHIKNTSGANYLKIESPTNANSGIIFNDGSNRALLAVDTSDNMIFYNGSIIETMRITSAGNVGIGTENPQGKLNINTSGSQATGSNAAINIIAHNFDASLRFGFSAATTGHEIKYKGVDGGNNNDLEFIAEGYPGDTSSKWMNVKQNGQVALGSGSLNDGTGVIFLPGSGSAYAGNVGIGTTSPSEKLHVYGNTNADVQLKIENDFAGKNAQLILDSGNVGDAIIQFKESGTTRGLIIYDGGTDVLKITNDGSSGTEHFAMDTSGNVGIGTFSPSEKLEVRGAIHVEGPAGSTNYLNFSANASSNNNTKILARGNQLLIKNNADFGVGSIDLEGQRINLLAPVTASGNISASGNFVANQITASGNLSFNSALVSDKVSLSYSENLDVDLGTSDIATVPHGTYDAAFFDYVLKNGGNMRAGTVMAVHDGTNIELTDVSTADLGKTELVRFSASLDSSNLILQASVPSNDWIIKTYIRGI